MFVSRFIPKVASGSVNVNILQNSLSLTKSLKKLQYKSCCYSSTNVLARVQNKLYMLNNCSNKALKRNFATAIPESNVSTFQHMLNVRKKQAHRSILLELCKKEDVPYALSFCERFGIIKNAYSFSGVSDNVYVLLEFNEEECVKEILSGAHFKNILDAFPVLTRIVGYTRKNDQVEPNVSVKVIENNLNTIPIKDGTVSDLIEHIYNEEKLTELNIRLRFFFCCLLKDMLSGPFPYCDVIPFGSSVNGIGRHGCDLDLMIRLYPEKIDSSSELYFVNKTCVGDIKNLQRRVVHCIGDLLRTFLPGITSVNKILHARVPIVKLEHKILGMDVDISVNNMAPILMSEILYFCGEIDSRIRPLIYAVKKWARDVNVTQSSPGTWFTNFSLALLVIYFLQNRPTPILPPLKEMIDIIGAEFTDQYRFEYLMTLPELQAKASQNKESIAVLLQEFLLYLGTYPFENKCISLMSGSATERASQHPAWIQYPLEEDLNVSKNVSQHELWNACKKAHASAKHLSANLNVRNVHLKDLSMLLGAADVLKIDEIKPKRVDVSTIMGRDARNFRNTVRRTS